MMMVGLKGCGLVNLNAGGEASSLAFILLGRCLFTCGLALRRLTIALEDAGVGGSFEHSPRKSCRLSMTTSGLSLKEETEWFII